MPTKPFTPPPASDLTDAEIRKLRRRMRDIRADIPKLPGMTWTYTDVRLRQGATYAEIAKELNLTAPGLRGLMHRGRSAPLKTPDTSKPPRALPVRHYKMEPH